MAELSVDQNQVIRYFQDNKKGFLIPDYQRPYAWSEEQCRTLWNDLLAFAIPEIDGEEFDEDRDYYLGSIVTFRNKENKAEVIDGQQRITTLMLLLRAFYESSTNMLDKGTISMRNEIAKCIWRTDEFGIEKIGLKITTEIASEEDKEEFLQILDEGKVPQNYKSLYSKNYLYFEKQIAEFKEKYPTYFAYFPNRIMLHCVLFPIETASQDTALLIFSTLNDRGLPLSDSDIFYSKFYKVFKERNEKDEFVEKWKTLSKIGDAIFHPNNAAPMDELFMKYMYYLRATSGETNLWTKGVRSYFEKENYKQFKDVGVFKMLQDIAFFWNDAINQDLTRFSEEVLKRLSIIYNASNLLPSHFVTVYFLMNMELEENQFLGMLDKVIACTLLYAICRPGQDYLRIPLYNEMAKIGSGKTTDFSQYAEWDEQQIRTAFIQFQSTRNQASKFMLYWWMYQNPRQELLSNEMKLNIEHIFAKNRNLEGILEKKESIELLGNKSLMENKLNIRASDYRFEDKKLYYLGRREVKGKKIAGTQVADLRELAETCETFTETDILARNNNMLQALIDYLRRFELVKEV